MTIITNAMTDVAIFNRLKERLVPMYGRPGVGLGTVTGSLFTEEFVKGVVAECEQAVKEAAETGVPLSPAQRMAMHVLLDSAQIDRAREPEQCPRPR